MDSLSQRGFMRASTSTFSFSWTIKYFLSVRKNTKPNEFISSPAIRSFGSEDNWYIKLYPNPMPNKNLMKVHNGSCYNETNSCISMVPDYTNKNGVEATVNLNICSPNCHNSVNNSQIQTLTFSFKENIKPGHNSFLRYNDLEISKDGSITINCQISEKIHYENVNNQIKNAVRLGEFDEFELLLQDEEYSDITLMMGPQKLLAHKCILSKKSPVFAAMFKHGMLENKTSVVEINDIDTNVMMEFLHYVYVAKVGDIQVIAKDLYIAADKYCVNNLKIICEDAICQNLTVSNVVEYLNFAISYDVKKLRNAVFDFIASNRESLKTN